MITFQFPLDVCDVHLFYNMLYNFVHQIVYSYINVELETLYLKFCENCRPPWVKRLRNGACTFYNLDDWYFHILCSLAYIPNLINKIYIRKVKREDKNVISKNPFSGFTVTQAHRINPKNLSSKFTVTCAWPNFTVSSKSQQRLKRQTDWQSNYLQNRHHQTHLSFHYFIRPTLEFKNTYQLGYVYNLKKSENWKHKVKWRWSKESKG